MSRESQQMSTAMDPGSATEGGTLGTLGQQTCPKAIKKQSGRVQDMTTFDRTMSKREQHIIKQSKT